MITMNTDSFVLGVDTYPEWFKEMDQAGRITYISTNPLIVDIQSELVTRAMTRANSGDTIMKIGNSAVVVPKAAAQKYMK